MSAFSLYTVTLNPSFDKDCLLDVMEPGRVSRVQESRTDPGGKGINISRVFAAFRKDCPALAVAGEENLRKLELLLRKEGVLGSFYRVPGSVRECVTYRLPDGREYKVNEAGPGMPEGSWKELGSWIGRQLEGTDPVLVFAGSLPPKLSPEEFCSLCRSFEGRARLVIDTSSLQVEQLLSCRPWVIKPNLEELEQMLGRWLPTVEEQVAAARELIGRGVEQVLISLGGDGLLGVTAHRAALVQVPKVTVCSTVGAGDSALAGYLMALSDGKDWLDALCQAAAFGTAAVMTQGTNPPVPETAAQILAQVTVSEL